MYKAETGGCQLGPSEAEDRKKHRDRLLLSHLKAALVFSLNAYWSGKLEKLILQQPQLLTDIYKARSGSSDASCIPHSHNIPQLSHTDQGISWLVVHLPEVHSLSPSWEDVLEQSRHQWHWYTQQKGRASLRNVVFHHQQLHCTAWVRRDRNLYLLPGQHLLGLIQKETLDWILPSRESKTHHRSENYTSIYINIIHLLIPVLTGTKSALLISHASCTDSLHLHFLASQMETGIIHIASVFFNIYDARSFIKGSLILLHILLENKVIIN